MIKIAYLILAHDNYEHLKRLMVALNSANARFFIHIDAKSRMPEGLPFPEKTTFVKREKIFWGGFSVIRATLSLMKEALGKKSDYYVLLSGQDYPIKPNVYLQNSIRSDFGEYMDVCIDEEEIQGKLKKVRYYHYEKCNRRKRSSIRTMAVLAFEKLLRKAGIRKNTADVPRIYFGAQWWVLSRSCVSYILSYVDKNPQYRRFFRTALCPDEVFFQTIVVNSIFGERIKNTLTYADWSEGKASPAEMTEGHLEALRQKRGVFLARKFTDDSRPLVAKIDKELRHQGREVETPHP